MDRGASAFAKGFVERLNVRTDEELKARRENEKTVRETLAAGTLKQWQTDMDMYSKNSASRSKAMGFWEQGNLRDLANLWSTDSSGNVDAALAEKRLKTLKSMSKEQIAAALETQYGAAAEPSLDDPKYKTYGAAAATQLARPRQTTVEEALLGIKPNKHQNFVSNLGQKNYVPTKTFKETTPTAALFGEAEPEYTISVDHKAQEVVYADKVDPTNVRKVSFADGSDAETQLSSLLSGLDLESPTGKETKDKMLMQLAVLRARGASEEEQYTTVIRGLMAGSDTIAKEMSKKGTYVLNSVDDKDNPIQIVVDATTGEPTISVRKVSQAPSATPAAISDAAENYILNQGLRADSADPKAVLISDMLEGSDVEASEAVKFMDAVSSRANYIREKDKVEQDQAIAQAFSELKPGLTRTETGVGKFTKDLLPKSLWEWIGTEARFDRPTTTAQPSTVPAEQPATTPAAKARTPEEVLFKYKGTDKWEKAKAQYQERTGKELPAWANE